MPIHITFIGTATAVIEMNGVNFLTDPFFSPAGRVWDLGVALLKVSNDPGLQMNQLPPIDAVLLSHEDHPDNLDDFGRQLLDGRRVFTTQDGAKNLAPRPGVAGMSPWETKPVYLNGQRYEITATPCVHMPGGECTGFVITTVDFGENGGLPNAIWFSGDTVYIEELQEIKKKFHISVAIMNIGGAKGPNDVPLTVDGKDASRIFKEIGADTLVPMHYESWGHFTENEEALRRAFEQSGIADRICWLEPGKKTKVL
ncbi:beta-lactamase superfamily domain-containing protein [Aspergillus pseudonomiae]|uniref:Beta-lactamase superfamily domain-containing protein n=1 Tax=Aspergillus pseudonomiae TaxID=1506151 RepID=A0A5N7DQW8_9EURO|nr:beta-lactamase superfamily domain-containing protein [Aspergillus pseudonomiae]KAE8408860.1 beta-lactamase superfamily domain-containing protein [Aspergillus pseudonomiae]